MNDLLASYTSLPNLHPAIVHLPIALLPLAVVFDLLTVLRRSQPSWDRVAVILYALGALGAAAAARAGEAAAESLQDVPAQVQPAIAEHSDSAHLAFYLFGALAAVRLYLWWRDRRAKKVERLPIRAGLLAVGVYAIAILLTAADQGGALVYRHALGVSLPASEAPAPSIDGPASGPTAEPVRDADGRLRWTPGPADVSALGVVLQPAAGVASDAVRTVPGSHGEAGLGLDVRGRALLVLSESFGDVQVDARLDLTGFEGAAGLAHHVVDERSRAHFAVGADGVASLVDYRDGRRTLVAEENAGTIPGAVDLGVSSTGRHLKGLVDGRTVVHGHIASGKPGAVGLFFEGTGTVRVVSLTVTPLGGS